MLVAPITSPPKLFWEGIQTGFYALEGEQLSIGCRGNVGFPPGTLVVSFIRNCPIETYRHSRLPAPVQLPIINQSLSLMADGS